MEKEKIKVYSTRLDPLGPLQLDVYKYAYRF